MREENIIDICRLCGQLTKMTKEHIPPKKAYNNTDQLFETLTHNIHGGTKQKFRGGIGLYSLCEDCNNKTGGEYGTGYVEFAKQGIGWLNVLACNEIEHFSFVIKPLNVLKQVCTMAIAMMPSPAIAKHWELRRFVLNKESRELPTEYAVYAYLTANNRKRLESGAVVANIKEQEQTLIYAEVTFPPFGFCVIKRKALLPPEQVRQHRLYPIDWWVCYEHNEPVSIELRLPRLPVSTPMPLDYRTEEEVLLQEMKSRG